MTPIDIRPSPNVVHRRHIHVCMRNFAAVRGAVSERTSNYQPDGYGNFQMYMYDVPDDRIDRHFEQSCCKLFCVDMNQELNYLHGKSKFYG